MEGVAKRLILGNSEYRTRPCAITDIEGEASMAELFLGAFGRTKSEWPSRVPDSRVRVFGTLCTTEGPKGSTEVKTPANQGASEVVMAGICPILDG